MQPSPGPGGVRHWGPDPCLEGHALNPGPTRFDDDDFPAYTMGRAAALIGVTPAFLRSLGEAGLISPQRSTGGHRRYSRHQLRLAARARALVDEGIPLLATVRIVALEDQLEAAHRRIIALETSR
jgi:MerR family transcriptional regulator/heat shock protein HspR